MSDSKDHTHINRFALAMHFEDRVVEAVGRAATHLRDGRRQDADIALIEADTYRAAAAVTRTVEL